MQEFLDGRFQEQRRHCLLDGNNCEVDNQSDLIDAIIECWEQDEKGDLYELLSLLSQSLTQDHTTISEKFTTDDIAGVFGQILLEKKRFDEAHLIIQILLRLEVVDSSKMLMFCDPIFIQTLHLCLDPVYSIEVRTDIVRLLGTMITTRPHLTELFILNSRMVEQFLQSTTNTESILCGLKYYLEILKHAPEPPESLTALLRSFVDPNNERDINIMALSCITAMKDGAREFVASIDIVPVLANISDYYLLCEFLKTVIVAAPAMEFNEGMLEVLTQIAQNGESTLRLLAIRCIGHVFKSVISERASLVNFMCQFFTDTFDIVHESVATTAKILQEMSDDEVAATDMRSWVCAFLESIRNEEEHELMSCVVRAIRILKRNSETDILEELSAIISQYEDSTLSSILDIED